MNNQKSNQPEEKQIKDLTLQEATTQYYVHAKRAQSLSVQLQEVQSLIQAIDERIQKLAKEESLNGDAEESGSNDLGDTTE
jgi:hypothetical protein